MLKILFMGTPDFATECLKKLIETKQDVAAVITQPDKAKGRGMNLGYSDVKKYALEQNLPIYQPETLKNGEIAELLDEIKPDVIVVVAYGKLLPKYVLDYPKYGCVNVHGSLLPKYRGAAPIQRAVINGEAVTGVTTMFMAEGLDTGDMLMKGEYQIDKNACTGTVFDDLAKLGADLLIKTLDGLEKGTITPTKQNDDEATHAAKITNEECLIDFNNNALQVHNKIRGLNPFPGAFCYLDGKIVKLSDSKVCDETTSEMPGKVISVNACGIKIACSGGVVEISRFKPEGKGFLTAADMVNGRKITLNSVFTTQK